MRLHGLTVSAFGPFPRTEHVDFDALNDAGLFLLSGATGAGKTSILDAVCFALYGQVPGVRGVKALKSQHAGDDAHPEVVLDFSVRDRRFVVRRSPEWSRPKRRGEGTTTEKARATLVELGPDGEHFLSHRAAEVGQLVADLVGMHAAQFQQVAMLPQGEFQRFLQASSQDRHDVLQRLFHTDRFARIEDWVADHSRERRDAAASGQAAVQRLVDTIADRAGVEVPAALCPDGLVRAAGAGEVLPWARALVDRADAAEAAARDRRREATLAAATTRTRLEEGRRLDAARRRRAEAERTLLELREEAGRVATATDALDAHRRATEALPALAVLDRAAREAEQAATSAERAEAAAARRGVRPEPTWEHTVAMLRDRAARADSLVPLLAEAEDAARTAAASQARLDTAVGTRDEARQIHDTFPAGRAAARAALDSARDLAGRVDALTLQLASTRQRSRAATDLPAARAALAALDDAVRDARDRAADARERMQDLLQRRLDGIAAELAGGLSDGIPCLVCGATEHPQPATSDQAPVTTEEHDEAGDAFDRAQREHADLVARRADAALQEASLSELAAGREAAAWAAEEATLRGELTAAEDAAARVETLARTLAELEERQVQADRAVRDAELLVAELTETVRAEAERAARTAQALAEAWESTLADPARPGSETGNDTPSEIPSELRSQDLRRCVAEARADLAAAELAHEAVATSATAEARAHEVATQAVEAARRSGFDGAEEVRAAVLTEPARARLDALLTEHARRDAAARAVLDDPALVAGQAAGPRDTATAGIALAALDAAARAADGEADDATRAFHHAEQRAAAVRALVARLEAALTAWAPAREDYALAESMSRLVRGMGGDNQLQLRLSSYVLATRLDQVLDAANERLSHLRDQRYLLQRTGRARRRGQQAGLGLEVVDQWTGDVREPATLSGGETFVVSLSLALGLADVVGHEAGGTEIETLFVDEGFGTLDADTLDDVMDRLDGLRAGGRTVGVVSHVAELRSRIPVQVHVDKTPSGSSIRVHALVR